MSEFSHSIVLFTGEDGLPLEFNVRNTTNKEYLKALIEHGGGFCTQNENSVHVISPGTKVLNVGLGKKLVSSTYILDCVKQNHLLDVNEYVFTIAEASTSDISDEDSEKLMMQRQSTCQSPKKRPAPAINIEISPIKRPSQNNVTSSSTSSSLTLPSSGGAVTLSKSPIKHTAISEEISAIERQNQKKKSSVASPNLTLPSSNNTVPPNSSSTHSESFVEGSQDVSSNIKITSHVYYGDTSRNLPTSPKAIKSPINLQEALDFESQSIVSPAKRVAATTDTFWTTSKLQSPSAIHETSPSPILTLSPDNKSDSNMILTPVKNENQWYNNAISVILSPFKNKHLETDVSKTFPTVFENSNLLKVNPVLKSPVNSPKTAESATVTESNNNNESDQSENMIPLLGIQENDCNIRLSESPPNITIEIPDKNIDVPQNKSPTHIVSSSQPEEIDLDKFDNILLSKVQRKPVSDDEEGLSQSYTVSSSADAQVNSKPCSAEDALPHSFEKNTDALPDSPNLSLSQMNVQDYMKNLEVEVEEILQKQAPKTIQDKILLVKYLCCARKLPPRTVLASLMTDPSELYV